MKRFAGRVTAILLTVAMVFTFIPFTGGSFAVHAEDAPQLTVSYDADSGRLEWEALEGAAYYEYGFYDTEMIRTTEEPLLLTMDQVAVDFGQSSVSGYPWVAAYDSSDDMLASWTSDDLYEYVNGQGEFEVYLDGNNHLTWEEVSGADTYKYYLDDVFAGSEPGVPEQDKIDLLLLANDLVADGLLTEAGSYTVKVEAYSGEELLGTGYVDFEPEIPLAEMTASIGDDGILTWEPVEGADTYYVSIGNGSWCFDVDTTSYDVAGRIDRMIRNNELSASDEGYDITLEAWDEGSNTIAQWTYTYMYDSQVQPVTVGEITGFTYDEASGKAAWDPYTDENLPTVCYKTFFRYGEDEDGQDLDRLTDTQYEYRWDLEYQYELGQIADGEEVEVGVRAYTYIDPENIPEDVDDIDSDDLVVIGECTKAITFRHKEPDTIDAQISDDSRLSWQEVSGADGYTVMIEDEPIDSQEIVDNCIHLNTYIDLMIRNHQLDKADDNKYQITISAFADGGHVLATWSDEYEYASEAEPVEVADMTVSIGSGWIEWNSLMGADGYNVTAAPANEPELSASAAVYESNAFDLDSLFSDLAYNIDNNGWEIAEGDTMTITVEAKDEDGVVIGRGTCNTEYYIPDSYESELDFAFDFDSETETLSWEAIDGAAYYTASYYSNFDEAESAQFKLDDGVESLAVRDFLEEWSQEDGAPALPDEERVTIHIRAFDEAGKMIGGAQYEDYYYEKDYPDIEVNFDEETGLLSWQKGEGIGDYELAYEYWQEVFTRDFEVNGNIYSINVYDFLDKNALSGFDFDYDEGGKLPLVLLAYDDTEASLRAAQHKFSVDHVLPEPQDIDAKVSEDGILTWTKPEGAVSFDLAIDDEKIEISGSDPAFEAGGIDLKAKIDELVEAGKVENGGSFIIDLSADNEKGFKFAYWRSGFNYVSDKAPEIKEIGNVNFTDGVMTWDAPEGAVRYDVTIDSDFNIEDITEASFGIDAYIESLDEADLEDYGPRKDVELTAYNSKGQKVGRWLGQYIYPEPDVDVAYATLSGVSTELVPGEPFPTNADIQFADEGDGYGNLIWIDTETGERSVGGDGFYEAQETPIAGHTYKCVLHLTLDPKYFFNDGFKLKYNDEVFSKDNGLVVEYTDSQKNEADISGFVDDVTVPGGEEPSGEDFENAVVSSNGSLLAFDAEDASPVKVTYTGEAITLDDMTVEVGGNTLVAGSDYDVAYENNTNAGKAKVTITGKGEFDGESIERYFTIEPKEIDGETLHEGLSMEIHNAYTGKRVDPEVAITIDGKQLVENTDYVLTRPQAGLSIKPGTYAMKLNLTGNYKGGFEEVQYVIDPIPMSAVKVELPQTSYEHTGSAIKPEPVVTYYNEADGSTKTFKKGTDYTVSYSKNTDVGTATVKVTAIEDSEEGWLSGQKSVDFTIKPSLKEAEVTMLYNSQSGYMPLTDRIHMYNDSSYELEGVTCKVVVDGAELVEGKDFTMSFENNEGSRDDMKVVFTGKGDYEGTEKVVDGIKIRKAKVTIKDQVLDPLHMDPQKMEETVVLEAGNGIPEKTLTRDTDYIVDGGMYELVPGETTAVIMAKNTGDYVGIFDVPCTFLPTPMSSVEIKLPEAAYTFTGKAITPAPVVTFKSSNGKTMTLENGTDYTVSYADNVNAGTATVKVTGKERFSGEKNVEFTIKPSVESAQVKVRGEDPTQNVYLFDPNEWDSSCYYQLIPDEVDVEYGDKTLKEGQDYSFMFTYEEAPEKLRMTLRGEGEYAGEKVIDIPMAEVEAKIDDAVLTDIFDAPELSGTVKIIGGTDKGKVLTEGTDYKLTYGGDWFPGEGKYVEIEGIGRYSGYMSAKCKLLPSPMASQNVTVTLPASAYTYSGKAIMPTPVVKFKSGKAGMVTLKNGTDYTVSCAGNVNAGTATVKVTGKGRFSGVKSATFKINKAANTLSVKAKKATVKAKKLKKKNQTLSVTKVLTVSKKIGKVTYVKKGGNKKISINATTGKVTVKKKLKKGTYKVKVDVTASGDANHNAATKQVTFKVNVK